MDYHFLVFIIKNTHLYKFHINLQSGDFVKRILFIGILALLIIPMSALALVTFAGDQVNIVEPVNDDVFVTGNAIYVNAPVQGITAIGNTITITAPVKGDVTAAGGTVTINNDIGGSVVAVGGNVDIAGNVSNNVEIHGGIVTIRKSVTIGKDATITAGSVQNDGAVLGTLSIQNQSGENRIRAGTYEVKPDQSPMKLFGWLFVVAAILLILGWFIIGLLLIRIMPVRFLQVESEIRTNGIVNFVVGFAAIIIAIVGFVLFAITIVLLPLALVLGGMILIGLLLANLFVALSLGRAICGYFNWTVKEWQFYTIGFLALCILFLIPIINILVFVISSCLGFGATLYAIQKNWGSITGTSTS